MGGGREKILRRRFFDNAVMIDKLSRKSPMNFIGLFYFKKELLSGFKNALGSKLRT
jgi:hypothetical protein